MDPKRGLKGAGDIRHGSLKEENKKAIHVYEKKRITIKKQKWPHHNFLESKIKGVEEPLLLLTARISNLERSTSLL